MEHVAQNSCEITGKKRIDMRTVFAILIVFCHGCSLMHQATSSDLEILVDRYGATTIPFDDSRIDFDRRTFDDDDFAAAFPYLQRYGKIEVISFSGRSISDNSVSLILQLRDLRELNVSSTAISISGLARLRALPNLDVLWVQRGQLSSTQMAELRATMPKTRINETDLVSR